VEFQNATYHCTHLIRNALHVPSMHNNLVPPFLLREAGIRVRDTPQIQVSDPAVEDHSICFPETGFRIPLSLWGTFSYFLTSKLTVEFMKGTEEVYLLTPSKWNPHYDAYTSNEANMLDWEGNSFLGQPFVIAIKLATRTLVLTPT
jgi:hypothetical protein